MQLAIVQSAVRGPIADRREESAGSGYSLRGQRPVSTDEYQEANVWMTVPVTDAGGRYAHNFATKINELTGTIG